MKLSTSLSQVQFLLSSPKYKWKGNKMTYKQRVTEYLRNQVVNHGMIDFHVSKTYPFTDNKCTEEEFFRELWCMINVPTVEDIEVLGKYSPKL